MLILILNYHVLGAQAQTFNEFSGVVLAANKDNRNVPLGAPHLLKYHLCGQRLEFKGSNDQIPVAHAEILLQLLWATE